MTSTPDTQPQQKLRNPHQVLDSIPELLGFRPRDSLCLLWLCRGTVRLVQRVDIPGESRHGTIADWAMEVVWAGRHAQADGALVIWITDSDLDTDLVGTVLRQLRVGGFDVTDSIVTDGRNYFTSSLTGSQRWVFTPGPPWQLPERDALTYRAAADADIAPMVGPLTPADDEALLADLLARDPGPRADRGLEGAKLLSILANHRVRDAVLWWITEEPHLRRKIRDRLATMLPNIRPGYGADVASIVAIAHWLDGNGARASMALERGAADDPQHRLVNLLGIALSSGLPPTLWREAMSDVTYEDCRGGRSPVEGHVESV